MQCNGSMYNTSMRQYLCTKGNQPPYVDIAPGLFKVLFSILLAVPDRAYGLTLITVNDVHATPNPSQTCHAERAHGHCRH